MRSSSWSFALRSEDASCFCCAWAAVANANATASAMPVSFFINSPVLRPSQQSRHQRDQEKHNEYDEQDLGDLGRPGSYAGEAEHRRDDRDDEKRKRPTQHDDSLIKWLQHREAEQSPCRARGVVRR